MKRTVIREDWHVPIVERDLREAQVVLTLAPVLERSRWPLSAWRTLHSTFWPGLPVRNPLIGKLERGFLRRRVWHIFRGYAALILYPEVYYARDREALPLDWGKFTQCLRHRIADHQNALRAFGPQER